MAQAKVDKKTVTKTIEEKVEVVTLELSREEAEAVGSVLGRVNSVGQNFTEKVYFALCEAGVNADRYTVHNRGLQVTVLSLTEVGVS